jgi:hypothetical protein
MGGDADQSMLIVTPRMALSRDGPRNPGHSTRDESRRGEASPSLMAGTAPSGAGAAFLAAAVGGATGAVGATIGSFVASGADAAAAEEGGITAVSSAPRASNRSSAVGVQRQ